MAREERIARPRAPTSGKSSPPTRTHGTETYDGKMFDRWPYEATSGGRIFYFVDDPTAGGTKRAVRTGRGPKPRRRVVIEAVHPRHPKATERKRR